MPRLFIAIPMPEEIAEQLDALCEGLPGVRWTDLEQFHLTLRFIGQVDNATFYDIGEALTTVSMAPFELRLRGIGQFPLRGHPHTLWVGLEDGEPVRRLRRRIERVLEQQVGLEPERRKYAPHVTIGRVKEPLPEHRYGRFLQSRSLFRSSPFPVTGFTLFSSILRPEGAEHVAEARYDFVSGAFERV